MTRQRDRWAREHEKHRRARALRREATEAERLLWSALRGRQLAGCKARRQVPIAQYIADFCFVEGRLVVELDGPYHEGSEQRSYDQAREAVILACGYRVLRFTNEQVLQSPAAVLAAIQAELDAIAGGANAPSCGSGESG